MTTEGIMTAGGDYDGQSGLDGQRLAILLEGS